MRSQLRVRGTKQNAPCVSYFATHVALECTNVGVRWGDSFEVRRSVGTRSASKLNVHLKMSKHTTTKEIWQSTEVETNPETERYGANPNTNINYDGTVARDAAKKSLIWHALNSQHSANRRLISVYDMFSARLNLSNVQRDVETPCISNERNIFFTSYGITSTDKLKKKRCSTSYGVKRSTRACRNQNQLSYAKGVLCKIWLSVARSGIYSILSGNFQYWTSISCQVPRNAFSSWEVRLQANSE